MRRLPLMALALLLILPGCQAIRADVGYGFGHPGVEVQIPAILHLGQGIGAYHYVGHDYDRGWRSGREDGRFEFLGSNTFVHLVGSMGDWTKPSDIEHLCMTFAPLWWDIESGISPKYSWALELDVHLLFASLRLGFNPWYLTEEAEERTMHISHRSQ